MLLNCVVGVLLRVPWAARRSNQSILKEISPEYSLEWLILKLKLQYFGHLIRRIDSFEKTLMLGKIKGRRRIWLRMRWLDGITDSMDIILVNSRSWWWDREAWRAESNNKPAFLLEIHSMRLKWKQSLNFYLFCISEYREGATPRTNHPKYYLFQKWFQRNYRAEEGQSEATHEAPLRPLHIRTQKLYAAGMIFSIMSS